MTPRDAARTMSLVIRNVCIHVANEQPLLADLFAMPSSADAGLVCTNVRSMDGKRPVFIDHSASTFFFPYHVVRFLEIPEGEMARYHAQDRRGSLAQSDADAPWETRTDDADGRAGSGDDTGDEGSLLPVVVGGAQDPDEDGDLDLEIDEGFLQRIRDI